MPLSPNNKLAVRNAIADFCSDAEAVEWKWSYTQQRPYSGLGKPAGSYHDNDCSSYVALCFHHASHEIGVFMADPLGMRYSGYGYTGSQIKWLKENGSLAPVDKYLIGDMAIWGHSASNTTHTAICRKRGTKETAIWSSHGNEGGPQPVKLGYHPHVLIGVWRHPALR
jgi:hypothetical protein